MKVYLAGKIGKNDWRHDIFQGLREADPTNQFRFPVPATLSNNEFEYSGPFFISCDHGCYHDRGSHGRGAQRSDYACGQRSDTRKEVLNKCLRWIQDSDIVFCWFDSPDAYGTIAEIGYAKAQGKQIFIAISENMVLNHRDSIDDCWFMLEMADSLCRAETATDAWNIFVGRFGTAGPTNQSETPIRPFVSTEQANYVTGFLTQNKLGLTIPVHALTGEQANQLIAHFRHNQPLSDEMTALLKDISDDREAFMYKATEVVKLVKEALTPHGITFTMPKHTKCVNHFGERALATRKFLTYNTFGSLVYSRLWIDFLIETLYVRESYEEICVRKKAV